MTHQIEKLQPAFKDYIWGGSKLNDIYHKNSGLARTAESWELSAHPAGESVLAQGAFAGKTFTQYLQENPGVLGVHCQAFENFPVLIKLIDAQKPLSVQVHPDNDYALRVEHEYGKTEMWYVMDCDEGAGLYFGFDRAVSSEEFARRIADNTLTQILRWVPVHPGDVFFIQAGTLHAIGAGILICEIQQNSNTTYRVYDYGRLGDDGKPRALHVEKALQVTRLSPSENKAQSARGQAICGGEKRALASCPYFTVAEYTVNSSIALSVTPDSFLSLVVTKGSCTVKGENTVQANAGESLFIPAASGEITVTGACTLIATTV